jgi:hypothetical protein
MLTSDITMRLLKRIWSNLAFTDVCPAKVFCKINVKTKYVSAQQKSSQIPCPKGAEIKA